MQLKSVWIGCCNKRGQARGRNFFDCFLLLLISIVARCCVCSIQQYVYCICMRMCVRLTTKKRINVEKIDTADLKSIFGSNSKCKNFPVYAKSHFFNHEWNSFQLTVVKVMFSIYTVFFCSASTVFLFVVVVDLHIEKIHTLNFFLHSQGEVFPFHGYTKFFNVRIV